MNPANQFGTDVAWKVQINIGCRGELLIEKTAEGKPARNGIDM